MLSGVLIAKMKLPMLSFLNDVSDVKRGRLGAFLAFHGATPPARERAFQDVGWLRFVPFVCESLNRVGLAAQPNLGDFRSCGLLNPHCN
jgi:hypothetical protein